MFCPVYRPTSLEEQTLPVKVAVDKDLMVVGGPDGTVSLYRTTRWSAHSVALWSAHIHDGPVTSVVVCSTAGFAFSAGRDGHVYRHDIRVTTTTPSAKLDASAQSSNDGGDVIATAQVDASKIVCRVSGEINVIALDDERTKLFVAGDSVRYITLGLHPSVVSVPVHIAAPIVALALSPCGKLIAAASGATGDVSIVGLSPPPLSEATQSPDALLSIASLDVAFPFSATKFVLRAVTPSSWKKSENVSCGFSWCRGEPTSTAAAAAAAAAAPLDQSATNSASSSSLYILALPTADGVRLMRFIPKAHPLNPRPEEHTLENVFTVSLGGFLDTTSVLAVTHTKHDISLAMNGVDTLAGGGSGGDEGRPIQTTSVVVVKVSLNKKGKVTGTQRIGEFPTPAPCSDVAVDRLNSGTMSIGTVTGSIAVIKAAVPLARKLRAQTAAAVEQQRVKSAVADLAAPPLSSSLVPTKATAPPLVDVDDEEEQLKQPPKKEKPRRTHESSSDDDDGDDGDTAAEGDEDDYRSVVKDLIRGKDHILQDGAKRQTSLRGGASHPKKPTTTASSARASYLDDEAEEGEEDSDDDNAGDRDSDDEYDEADDHEDDNEDDDGVNSLQGDDGQHSATDERLVRSGDDRSNGARSRQQHNTASGSGASVAERDYHFQPGATPLKVVDGVSTPSCYLSYNSIGCIRFGGDGTSIQFHDVSRASIKLQERGRVMMAALGHSGAAFVIDITGTEEALQHEATTGVHAPLVLYFRTYSALGAQSDWSVQLLIGETCRSVAVGLRFVALATSVGLRIFSMSGLEMAVIAMPSRVVTMVGCNSTRLAQSLRHDQDPLAVAYLTAGSGNLEVVVYNCHNGTVQTPPTACPVTLDAEYGDHYLQWLGFSDDGPLHTCDSAGVVRMYTNEWGGSWTPVHDPRHFTADSIYQYWIWAVNDQHMFAYRSTRGGHDDPFPVASTVAPPMEQVRLCLPLLKSSNGGEKRMLVRDRFIRTTIKMNDIKRTSKYYTEQIAKLDMAHDARLMDMFKTALKEQQTSRAVDLATMFELRDSVEEAAREANKEGHKSVVLKLVQIIEMRHKLKAKRNCTLPLESQDVSEKERDMILRRLLQKEKQQQQQDSSTVNATRTSGGHTSTAVAATVQLPVTLHKSVRLDEETLHTMEATAEEAAAAAAPPQRRSVVFDDKPTSAAATKPALVLAATPGGASLAAKAPLATTTTALSADLPLKKPEPPRFGKAAPSAAATPTAPVVLAAGAPSTIIGAPAAAASASNAATSKPLPPGRASSTSAPRAASPTIAAATATTHPAAEGPQQPQPPAVVVVSSLLKANTNTTANALAASSSPVRPKATAAPKSVTPKSALKSASKPLQAPVAPSVYEQPAPAFVDLSSIPAAAPLYSSSLSSASLNGSSSASLAPMDPFLNPGEDGTRVGYGMRDVGHFEADAEAGAMSSSQVMPKSLSFGEALRKRLREEDEDVENEDAPPKAMSSLFK